jgi:monofunctional biosynthetic peptidoglycan transglycosylase
MREIKLSNLQHTNPLQTSFIRYRAKTIETNIGIHEWTSLGDMSAFLVASMIKAEDPNFFSHRGIHWKTNFRKAIHALRRRKPVRGVSSITQQTARNLFLTPVRTFRRKLMEAIYAVRLEQVLSKERILEIYLNVIEWGNGVWGCTSAAGHYFGKNPRDLDLFESIFLASIVPAPCAGLSNNNLKRMWKSQMETLHLLYLSELVTLAQFAVTLQKAKLVYERLAQGSDLQSALAGSPEKVDIPVLPVINQDDACSCTLQSILDTECGLYKEAERRRSLERRFGKPLLYRAIITADYSLLNEGS